MAGAPDFLWLLGSEEILQLMLFACPDGIVVVDRTGRVILYTGSSEQIFGFAPIDVLRRPAATLFASESDWEHFSDALARSGTVTNKEMQAVRKDGSGFWVSVSASILRDRCGDIIGTVLYVRDHSDMRNIESTLRDRNRQLNDLVEELDFLARHDQLTGLLNRGGALESAQTALASCGLTGRPFGVVLFDLDLFKQVNDAFGHLIGDEALQALATVMRQAARAGDIVGRYGGEEFIAFLPGADLEQTTLIAERVRVAVSLAAILVGEDTGINVTVSAGVAVIPSCADNLSEAIRMADNRLFIAKRSGRNRVVASDTPTDGQDERSAA